MENGQKKSVTPSFALQLSELRGNAGDSAVTTSHSILKKINTADPSIYCGSAKTKMLYWILF